MSKRSKAKRDAKRKNLPMQTRVRRTGHQIEPHGEMRDEAGRVVAGIGRQSNDWVLVVGDQVLGGGTGAADVMVMFNHLAEIRQKDGGGVFNSYSTTFKAEAERDAEKQGMSLYEYIQRAREDMAESDDEEPNTDAERESDPEAV